MPHTRKPPVCTAAVATMRARHAVSRSGGMPLLLRVMPLVFLAGCAAHPRAPIDDDGLPVTTAADDNPPATPDPGRGRGLWSGVLHRGVQAGMGMIHY